MTRRNHEPDEREDRERRIGDGDERTDRDLFPDDEENEERRRDPLRNRLPE